MRLFFLRYGPWTIIACILGFFLITEIGITRERSIQTDFLHPHRSFSVIGPPVRIDGYDQKMAALRIVGEPVYVDVRVPRLARTGTITLWGGGGVVSPAVGIEQDGVIVSLTPLAEKPFEEGYMPSDASFDFSGLKRTDGAIRFVISLPSVTTTTPFFLHRLRVVTTRPLFAHVISTLWK